MYMNQEDAQLLTNNLYFPYFAQHVSDVLSVHHQEHNLVNCITHLVHSCCVQSGHSTQVKVLKVSQVKVRSRSAQCTVRSKYGHAQLKIQS